MINASDKEKLIDLLQNFSGIPKLNYLGTKVSLIETGHLHQTFVLKDKEGGIKYVIQKLNPVFNLKEVNANLVLFDKAQKKSLNFLPEYWQQVNYYKIKSFKNNQKIFFDNNGSAWRIMNFVRGRIFNDFGQIPVKDRYRLAFSFGEGLAVFGRILAEIPQKKWGQPLPNFHNTDYHYNYLRLVLEGKEIPLNLSSNKLNRVKLDRKRLKKYEKRVNNLLSKIEKRKDLINCLDGIEEAVVHGDPKLNNAVFVRDNSNNWKCSALIDLDTIQIGSFLDDLGDGLRSAGNSVGEEPSKLSDVKIDINTVDGLMAGYLGKIKYFYGSKKSEELKKYVYKAYSKFLYELGIRFLADFLVGSRYFVLTDRKTSLNLYRAEVQMKALESLEEIVDKK